jgi:hypothetical protein
VASKSKAVSATFHGVKNRRPVFSWGDELPPPAWLLKHIARGTVEGDSFVLGEVAMKSGQKLAGSDG